MIYADPGTKDAVMSFKERYQNYIGGRWVEPRNGQYFDNISPVNGKVFCQIPRSDQAILNLRLMPLIKPKMLGARHQ